MTNNTYITFGETTFTKRGTPTFEIVMVKNEERKVVGYLTPFRDYRFQISLTNDGQCDIGSTPVVPNMSAELRKADVDIARNYVSGQIIWAMMQYTNNAYGQRDSDGEAIAILPNFEDMKTLDRVTTTVLKWMGVTDKTYYADNEPTKETPKNGWSCSQKQYDQIMNHGKQIIDDMFGDLLNMKF